MKSKFTLSSILIVLSSHSMATSQNPEPIVEVNGEKFKTQILQGSFIEHSEALRKSFLASPVSINDSSSKLAAHIRFVGDFYIEYRNQSGNYRPNFFDPDYTGPWEQYPEGPWAYNTNTGVLGDAVIRDCVWQPSSSWWDVSSPCFTDVDDYLFRVLQQSTFFWIVVNRIPSPIHTLSSFRPNAFALRNAFNLQSAKIAQGLSYDCTVYDQKNICVSFAGSKSDGKGFDATTGALIIAHKPTTNFRFGGYIDQSFGSSTSGGLTTKNGNPGFGAFAVWSQNADGSGVQVRAAANVGKVDIETTREEIGSAEAGFGKSNIKSQGFSLEVSKDYALNSMWSARPYVGYRKTTNTRAGYTETQGAESPLTYGSLKQNTETVTAGATFAHTLSANTTLFLTAGVEHDLKNSIGRYAATSTDIEGIDSIDMGSNKTKTRPTVSFALNHDIDKTQRVGVSLTHRKEAFASGSTTSAFLQYSKGF